MIPKLQIIWKGLRLSKRLEEDIQKKGETGDTRGSERPAGGVQKEGGFGATRSGDGCEGWDVDSLPKKPCFTVSGEQLEPTVLWLKGNWATVEIKTKVLGLHSMALNIMT